MSDSQRTTSRRMALQSAFTGLLAAGALSVLPPATSAAAAPVAVAQPATIDRAEALLLDFERVMVQLTGQERSDLSVELARLVDIAEANNAREAAADTPRQTGADRTSLAWERGHVLAHTEIMPRYGEQIMVAVAAGEAARGGYEAKRAARDALATGYTAARDADAERYGVAGRDGWAIAETWALFGHCDECVSIEERRELGID